MADLADLAGLPELELAWRTLTTAETDRATYKLGQASRYVRHHFPDVDARILSGQLLAESVSDVVVAMVERAFPTRTGVRSESSDKGPFRDTVTYFDDKGGMYLTDEEREVLAPAAASDQGASSTRPAFVSDACVPG